MPWHTYTTENNCEGSDLSFLYADPRDSMEVVVFDSKDPYTLNHLPGPFSSDLHTKSQRELEGRSHTIPCRECEV